MTPTDVDNLIFWVVLVLVVAGTFGLFAWALTVLEDRIQAALEELEPYVDDVTERRRLHALVEWKR